MASRHSLCSFSSAIAITFFILPTIAAESSACSPLPASGVINGVDLFAPSNSCRLNVTDQVNYFDPTNVGSQSPYKCPTSVMQSDSNGTGIHAPAVAHLDPSLPKHVIYAPANPPDEKMPVILFAEGACYDWGTLFRPLMKEWASHGYLVVADGEHEENDGSVLLREGLMSMRNAMTRNPTTASFTLSSLDWVRNGAGNGKFGKVDTDNVAVAGQSCGGQKAYSAGWKNANIKALGLFNSGLEDRSKECLIQHFDQPTAHFIGGPLDSAYENAQKDHALLKSPAVLMSLDTGNLGTYLSHGGGKFGTVSTAWWDFVLKGSSVAGYNFLGSNSSWPSQGWNLTSKNWDKYTGLGARGALANRRSLSREIPSWNKPSVHRASRLSLSPLA